jgi:15-cis-phytoene synthase
VIAKTHVLSASPRPLSVAQSYTACDRIARRAASSFYPAFHLLPAAQRRAMCAVYAFFRIADDISDEPAPIEDKRRQLALFREGFDRALHGDPTLAIHAALRDTVEHFRIPPRYLMAAIDGVEMDLTATTYATFADLQSYCYHVASVVGLACIHIWGAGGSRAEQYAVDAGIAFQLTNILRDLGEDAARGRVYLPQEDLHRFGYSSADLARGFQGNGYRALMQFEVARARAFYDAAWPLVALLKPPGRAVFLMMARTYRALLSAMEVRDYDVFSSRVRISRWRKIVLALGALPARWGF